MEEGGNLMDEKLEELKALLAQDTSNLTEYGKERIDILMEEINEIEDLNI
jgi:hypothetical protein